MSEKKAALTERNVMKAGEIARMKRQIKELTAENKAPREEARELRRVMVWGSKGLLNIIGSTH